MSTAMAGYRRAAVTLHALSEQDRQWILSELPEQERLALHSCLNELKELGFSEGSILPSEVPKPVMEEPVVKTPMDCIASASAAQMTQLLECEPPSLVAQVLALHDWPWQAEFMKQLPAVRMQSILRVDTEAASVAPARKQCLLDIVAARLQSPVIQDNGHGARSGKHSASSRRAPRLLNTLRNLVRPWKRS